MARVFISTGEASGDVVGAGIASHLTGLHPHVTLEGIGSSRMQQAGVALWADSRDWAAIGITQALRVAPRVWALLKRLQSYLLRNPPSALVLVDFGAFNVPLGRWAKVHGIPTVYAMPPSSWRKTVNPAKTARLVQAADLFLCPFAWNADNLTTAGATARHIGHPVLDLAAPSARCDVLRRQLRPERGRLIALLPGSRHHEIGVLAPTMARCATAWPWPDDRFVMVQAPSLSDAALAESIGREAGSTRVAVVRESAADVLAAADLAAVCSGTATLEAAVTGTPFVTVYDGPWVMRLEWRLRRRRIKAPLIAMPNIIAGSAIVPELIAEAATSDNIVAALRRIAEDPIAQSRMRDNLEVVRDQLRPAGALRTAAKAIAAIVDL